MEIKRRPWEPHHATRSGLMYGKAVPEVKGFQLLHLQAYFAQRFVIKLDAAVRLICGLD
jgi:hypothetical protein